MSSAERAVLRARLDETLRRHAIENGPQIRARRALALVLARDAAARLRDEFCATRVAVFGSLARADFGLFSDVDLIAWGIPGARQAAAFCAVGGEREYPGSLGPDLLFAETVSPDFLLAIAEDLLDL